ncbi:MAG: A/G-specific adenine glycosylase [Candidatus Tectomicrobia bacterium]|uniref:Adenine DNA glycosylase n=1 Tax=Tectimicrobiota bacterium TaxID=2528274 RepID=A0A933E943_UNCTE|nr:A/G-specific adenine glycosylase [Candidatus Tectomicrobia bacterium]
MRELLLGWYGQERRSLPWRGEREPYRIWVSEAMLQQTRAGTAAPRYARFLARFPTLRALAGAPLEAVLAEWQGLGYYGRARSLHRAAREVAERLGGELPAGLAALRALPGFGPYMAGAVGSIAFGLRVPAVDGNVLRVLARLLDLAPPVDKPPGRAAVEKEAEALLPRVRPGDFNQALMDLGARLCLPRNPRCGDCPLEALCAARKAGTAAQRPVRSPKRPPREATVFQLWAEQRGRLRLVRREEDGLFGGLWELPGWMAGGGPEPSEREWARACAKHLGPGWKAGGEIARAARVLTHRRILFVLRRALPPEGKRISLKDADGAMWVDAEALKALPLSNAQRAAIAAGRRGIGEGQGRLFG